MRSCGLFQRLISQFSSFFDIPVRIDEEISDTEDDTLLRKATTFSVYLFAATVQGAGRKR